MEQKRKQICYRGVEASGSAWHYANDMDEIITAGHYSVCLSHDNLASMGIVTAPCDAEHKVVVQLIVTESAIANKQQHGRVVGQTLVFAACDGATVEILNRTAEKLENGFAWQQWNRMSQKIEVGEVTSLDDCTESGTYNGVFTNGQNKHETFIMVVINNAPVAEACGKIRCISQFKYALGTDSNFSYKTRTGRGDDDIEWGDWVDLGAATTTDIQDGAITAHKLSTDLLAQINNNTAAIAAERTRAMGQEELLNNANETEKTRALKAEADAVEKGRQLALRALFVAAGAEYNDSGADKTKTALWGENVTHKAEHYYLNGLGDITEEQMVKIYNRGNFNDADIAPLSDSFSHANNIRTNLPRVGRWNGNLQTYLCVSNKRIEVLTLHVAKFSLSENCNITFSSTASLFEDSSALSVIDTRCRLVSSSWSGNSFKDCVSLKELRIEKLENNIVFAQSSQLSKASVLFAIEKAIPTAPISITLHPEAYARLADDADVVSALEAQPLISLVSA